MSSVNHRCRSLKASLENTQLAFFILSPFSSRSTKNSHLNKRCIKMITQAEQAEIFQALPAKEIQTFDKGKVSENWRRKAMGLRPGLDALL
jgi:hypothetical protein